MSQQLFHCTAIWPLNNMPALLQLPVSIKTDIWDWDQPSSYFLPPNLSCLIDTTFPGLNPPAISLCHCEFVTVATLICATELMIDVKWLILVPFETVLVFMCWPVSAGTSVYSVIRWDVEISNGAWGQQTNLLLTFLMHALWLPFYNC